MKLYQDPFLFKTSAKVKNITEKNDFLFAEFDRTNFYPGGGGQPNDIGTVENENFTGKVVSVEKINNRIIHKIKPIKGKLSIDDKVNLNINKNRRISLIKMHTGEHILFKSIKKQIPDIKLDKIDLKQDESSLYVKSNNLSWKTLFEAEDLANSIIQADKKIHIKFLDKTEAEKNKELRIKLDRISSEKIRVIEIDDFDLSACAGIHAKTTGFVKNIIITKFVFQKGSYEIRFKTDAINKIFNYSKTARQAADILNTDPDSVISLLKKTIHERDEFKEKYRNLLDKIPVSLNTEKTGNIIFKYKVFENYNRKKLIDTINENKEDDSIILLINKKEKNATVMLTCSDTLDYDILQILKKSFRKFNGKGGGRNKFAQGSVNSKHINALIKEIRNLIQNI
ncbi:hypothetical protein GF327_07725 [Candidatus Woesearchaeota archaeon]|nr:hypothetical protein [Candidatus Woesearchaeota archaeon]